MNNKIKNLAEMHRDFLSYPGVASQDRWLLATTHAEFNQICKLSPNQASRAWIMGSAFPVGASAISAVRLMSIPSNIDLFAKTLSTMTQLAYLSIPDEFAGELTPGLLPSSIKILEFPGQELSKFDKDIVFPSVERIIAGKTRLESFNVPKLLHLDLHLDKNMGKHIGKFHLLNTLNIQSFRDSTFLADIPSEQLVFLGIRGNSPHSWEFLRNLTCLRGLWIQNIGGCFDLSNLHFCSALEELTLGYCEIQYPEHLLNLSHLKAIHLFGCKANSDITKQLDELKEKGVSVFSSGL